MGWKTEMFSPLTSIETNETRIINVYITVILQSKKKTQISEQNSKNVNLNKISLHPSNMSCVQGLSVPLSPNLYCVQLTCYWILPACHFKLEISILISLLPYANQAYKLFPFHFSFAMPDCSHENSHNYNVIFLLQLLTDGI